MKEETHFAKQVYLYGDGETKPIKNIKKLSDYCNCPVSTIQDHVQGWRKTAEELAIQHDNSPYSLSLSNSTLAQHEAEIDFLGKAVSKMRNELKKVANEYGLAHPTYLSLFNSYQTALTKWEKSSGILAHYNTAEAAMKERARAHERVKGKLGEGAKPKLKRKVNRSRFDIEG